MVSSARGNRTQQASPLLQNRRENRGRTDGKTKTGVQLSSGITRDALLLGHSDFEAKQMLSLPLLKDVAVLGKSICEFWS